jgi:hypothetical protein
MKIDFNFSQNGAGMRSKFFRNKKLDIFYSNILKMHRGVFRGILEKGILV